MVMKEYFSFFYKYPCDFTSFFETKNLKKNLIETEISILNFWHKNKIEEISRESYMKLRILLHKLFLPHCEICKRTKYIHLFLELFIHQILKWFMIFLSPFNFPDWKIITAGLASEAGEQTQLFKFVFSFATQNYVGCYVKELPKSFSAWLNCK